MKKSIAVIGQGFVGGSLITCFSERGFDVYAYDKAGKTVPAAKPCHKTTIFQKTSSFPRAGGIEETFSPIEAIVFPNSITELVDGCEKIKDFLGIYFVCLPTPMREDGSCDLSIVEGVLDELSQIPGQRIAVIKSTVPPGTTSIWNKKYEKTGLRLVFNPEFLREVSALDDMRNQDRIVLGGPRPFINKVKQLYQTAFPNVPLIKTSSTTAEMIKYLTNNFLTVKVAFANEMSQICVALDEKGFDIDYDKVVEYATYDKRLGDSHWAVPGPDGHHGFGGSCFVKDLNAMTYIAKTLNVKPLLLEAAWQKNLEVRPERDWEKLVGRAVSKKESK